MIEKANIYKYKGIPGIYGERYAVPVNLTKITKLFEQLSVWSNGKKKINGQICNIFEMPLGKTGAFAYNVESSPLIMFWVDQSAEISELTADDVVEELHV